MGGATFAVSVMLKKTVMETARISKIGLPHTSLSRLLPALFVTMYRCKICSQSIPASSKKGHLSEPGSM